MAIPPNTETMRGLELQEKFKAAGPLSVKNWPIPTKDDYAVFGHFIVLYSYVEFQLRQLATLFENAKLLPPIKSKAADLNISDLEKVIRETNVWAGPEDLKPLDDLSHGRLLRNLIAHFAVRRFPEDDAFLFLTMSAKDFKKCFDRDPAPGEIMSAITECKDVIDTLKYMEYIHGWLAPVFRGFAKQLLPNRER